jgi:hypothetical protein
MQQTSPPDGSRRREFSKSKEQKSKKRKAKSEKREARNSTLRQALRFMNYRKRRAPTANESFPDQR